MAYAGVISLKQTIHRLLNASHDIAIASSSREIIEFAYKEVTSLQQALKRLDNRSGSGSGSGNKRLNDLDGQIRDAVHKLEDILEFQEANQFPSESEGHNRDLDFDEVSQEISSLAERLKKMDEEYNQILDNALPKEEEEEDDDDDAAAVSSTIDFGVEMVGLSNQLSDIKGDLRVLTRPNEFGVFSIIGVPGTCRSVIAKMLFDELYINGEGNYFDCGAWVTIGSKYQFKEILLSIISQIDDLAANDEFLNSEGVDSYLCTVLKGRRYMIVLDDVSDTQIRDHLMSTFPMQHNGSLVLLTTRHKEVARHARSFCIYNYQPNPDDAIADMLRLMVDGGSWPPQFEEAGQKIAENCQGLRIMLAKVRVLLSKTETLEGWKKIAADEENSIFKPVEDELLEMRKIKEDLEQLSNSFPDKVVPSNLTPEEMIGLPKEVEFIKTKLFPKRFFSNMEVISLVGMPGIGKTTFVKRIFEDPDILVKFNHYAWVTLGPKYQSKEILVDILAQIYPDIGKMHMKRDTKLAKDLCAKLSNKKCLIVFDDVWDKEPLLYLAKLFPDIMGKALVTTRLAKVARFGKQDIVYKMRLLNKEESWCLFRQKVFDEDQFCSPELEKAGKRISDYCEGLPLLILTIADLLSKAEKTAEYWNKVADKKKFCYQGST